MHAAPDFKGTEIQRLHFVKAQDVIPEPESMEGFVTRAQAFSLLILSHVCRPKGRSEVTYPSQII